MDQIENKVKPRKRKRIELGPADLKPGERRIITVEGRSIGLFNVAGDYFALLNRCPHMGGPLCEGPVTGTCLPSDRTAFTYGMIGEIVRCGWHGWEFEIKTGRCLGDPHLRVRRYAVELAGDRLILII